MEKWKKRAVDLMTSLAFGGRVDSSVVPYYPQKNRINMPEEQFFPRSTPEKHGISSKRIYHMLCELEGERHANIHNLMVLCGGEVISECSADGYDTGSWHISHSMAKTVCGMVIGTLYDEGRLKMNEKVVDILSDVPYRDKKFPLITVEHLLTMTSGVDFAEAGVVTDSEWTSTFFSAEVKFVPGTKFEYNSMNTYILARIAERVSGESFGELVRERIFAPLGIKNYFWEKGPEGTEKAGWGLYMSAESWAKLGYMISRGGVFGSRRILSEEWVRESSTYKVTAPEFNGNFNYAYQMWTAREKEEALFNGMLGQNVWICPKNDIIVVMQCGNNELFQASPALEIVRKYLGGTIDDAYNKRDVRILAEKEATFFDRRRWVRPREKSRGLLCWLGFRPRESFDERWLPVLGSYAFGNNNVGMIPLIVRAMQNNLKSSLEEINLVRDGNELYLDYKECGEYFRIHLGLYGYENNILNLRGEYYIIKAMAEARWLPDGKTEYRIELILPETASVRRITILRESDRIKLTLSELPNDRVVENMIARYSETASTLAFGIDLLEKRLGEGVVASTLKKTFSPTLVGADMSKSGYMNIVNEENRRVAEEAQKVKLIRAFVDRFFKENSPEKAPEPTPQIEAKVKKTISGIIEKISGKTRQSGAK